MPKLGERPTEKMRQSRQVRVAIDKAKSDEPNQYLLMKIEALERRLSPPPEQSTEESFGVRVRRLRKGTLRSLAGEVGISAAFLSDLEKDKRTPGAETLKKLAAALGVSMDFLWTGK